MKLLNIVLALGLSAAAANAQAALYQADITIDPSVYAAAGLNAPFFLDFQLNSGGGLAPVSNSVTLSDFQFIGGGSPTTGSSYFSGATVGGDLTSTVNLSDDAVNAYNEFYQGFSNGVSEIRFSINTTELVNAAAPDQFTAAILDSSAGFPQIATNDPLGLSLITISLGNPLQAAAYAGVGSAVGFNAAVSAVPVPAAAWLFGSALVSLIGLKQRKRA